MFFALEHVKTKKMKKCKLSKKHLEKKKTVQHLSKNASKLCICSPASQAKDIFPISILRVLIINISMFIISLLFFIVC